MAINKKDNSFLLESITEGKLINDRKLAEYVDTYHVQLYQELFSQRRKHKKALLEALQSTQGIQCDLTEWVRIVDLKYSTSPVSPIGSGYFLGGRFNVGEDVNNELRTNYALYVAEDEETAKNEKFPPNESNDKLTAEELSLRSKSSSYSCVKLDGKVNNIFDLEDEKACKNFLEIISKFRISKQCEVYGARVYKDPKHRWSILTDHNGLLKMCLEFNWRTQPVLFEIPSNSQIMGNLIREAGFAGVRYPSTKSSGYCLALFPENFDDESIVIAREPPAETKFKHLDGHNWEQQIFSIKHDTS